MVSNYPHLASHIGTHVEEEDGLSVLGRVRQVLCGMHGHDSLLQYEQDRLFLKCVSCGHESPGWVLNETPPTISVRADDRQRVPVQLISARRVA